MTIRLTLLVAVLCVLVAGCEEQSGPRQTQSPSTTSRPQSTSIATSPVPASPEARAWMDRFCRVGRELTITLSNGPRADTQTPEELQRWFVGQLDIGINGVVMAIQRFGELGPSHVDGADSALRDLTGQYSELRELFTSTKDKIGKLRPGFTEADLGRIVGESMSMPKHSRLMTYPFEGAQITQAMRDAGSASGSVCLSVLPRRSSWAERGRRAVTL